MVGSVPGRGIARWTRIARSPYTWVVGVYLVVWFAMPAEGRWINDNALRLLQSRTLLNSSFTDFSLAWPGLAFDPELRFQPVPTPLGIVREGRLFASYPPTFAALTTLPLALCGSRGLLLLPLLGALALFPAIRRLAAELAGERAGRLAVPLAAFAMPVWFYAYTLWEHTLTLALSTWCLLATVRFRREPTQFRALAAGGLAACAVWFRSDAYLLVAIVVLLCALASGARWTERWTAAGASVAGILPLWGLQQALLGHPLGLHLQSQRWDALTWSDYLAARLEVASNLLLNLHPAPAVSVGLAAGFWGLAFWRPRTDGALGRVALCAAGALAVVATIVVATAVLSHPRPMYALIRTNGLFAAAPLAVYSFFRPPGVSAGARRTLLAALFALVGVYAGLAPAMNSSGIHWGCRFLLPAYPVLAVLAAAAIVRAWEMRGALLRTLIALAFVAGIGLQAVGLGLLAERKDYNVRLDREVAAAGPLPIVTDVWFLPADLPGRFHETPIFLVRGSVGLKQLVRRLDRRGVSEILWIESRPDQEGVGPADPEVFDGRMGLRRLRLRRVPTRRLGPTGTGGGS